MRAYTGLFQQCIPSLVPKRVFFPCFFVFRDLFSKWLYKLKDKVFAGFYEQNSIYYVRFLTKLANYLTELVKIFFFFGFFFLKYFEEMYLGIHGTLVSP